MLSPVKRGALFYLSFFLSTGSFSPFLFIYYMELGFSGRQIGLLTVFFPVITLLFTTPLSALTDRKRWRIQILQVAIAGGALFIFLLKFPRTFGMVALLLVLLAIFFSPVMSIADSLIANMATHHGMNYGGMRLWGSIGFAVSATVCGMVWQRFELTPMFIIGSVLFIPIFITARTLDEGPLPDQGERRPITAVSHDFGLVILIVISFLVSISNSLAMSFEGIYVHYLGGVNMLVGIMIGISGFSEIPMMQFSQKIADRLKGPKILILSFGSMGAAYVGYVLAQAPCMMIPMAVFKGMGFGLSVRR